MQTNVNGEPYVAGMGIGVDNVGGYWGSTIAFVADRLLVFETPDKKSFKPVFATNQGQVFLNEAVMDKAFIKNLSAEQIRAQQAEIQRATIEHLQTETAVIGTVQLKNDSVTEPHVYEITRKLEKPSGDIFIDDFRLPDAKITDVQVAFVSKDTTVGIQYLYTSIYIDNDLLWKRPGYIEQHGEGDLRSDITVFTDDIFPACVSRKFYKKNGGRLRLKWTTDRPTQFAFPTVTLQIITTSWKV